MVDVNVGPAEARRLLGGRYEVGSLLGRGGMAEVHVAHDTRLGRTVAVKLLRADLARDPSFQARFRREAQSAASLNHPSVVAVYDTGADPSPQSGGGSVDLPYIVMEYVEGRTLRDMLRTEHPLALSESLQITEGVLAALEYSHRMGIVHRDIKPANVMITPSGEVKVMDFGIARAVSDSSATLTQTSAVMGTAQYLSPEQARGEQVDARSDLYSAGCLLYEVLTGRPPFVGDAPVAVAYQHVSEQPRPPSALDPGIPPAVDHVVLMALSKDREHRYQSAADFADDLRRAVEGRPLRGASIGAPAPAAPTEATRVVPAVAAPTAVGAATGTLPRVVEDDPDVEEPRRRWPWILLVLVLVLGVAAAAYALAQTDGRSSSTASPSPTATPVPDVVGRTQEEAQTALTDAGLTSTVVQAPDDTQPAGTVTATDPTSGTSAVLGTAVTLTVSSGPSAVTVPDLAGSTQDQAREQLTQAGLVAGTVEPTDEDPTADKGTVVRTDPGADASTQPGTAVKLYVASGQVVVPDLVGQARDTARAQLNDLGLQVNIDTQESSDASPGQVLSQSVTKGSTVDVGSEVDLVVASAPPSPTSSPTSSSPTTSPPASPTDSPAPTDPPTTQGAAAGPPVGGNGGGNGNGNGEGDG